VLHWTPLSRFVGVPVAAVSAGTLWLIVALQLFWFYKIVAMLLRGDKKSGGGGKKDDAAVSPDGSGHGLLAETQAASLGGVRFRGANAADAAAS
jgi:hypothetical protein